MSKITSFMRYIVGIDLLEERAKYHREHKEDGLGAKVYDAIDTGWMMVGRYAPLVLEGVGAFLISKGSEPAQWGALHVLGAEYIRVCEITSTRKRRYLDALVKNSIEALRQISRHEDNNEMFIRERYDGGKNEITKVRNTQSNV